MTPFIRDMLQQLPVTFSHANRANVRRTNTVDTKASFSHAQSTRGYDSNKHAWTPVSHFSADKKGKPCGLCPLRKWSSCFREFGKTNTDTLCVQWLTLPRFLQTRSQISVTRFATHEISHNKQLLLGISNRTFAWSQYIPRNFQQKWASSTHSHSWTT